MMLWFVGTGISGYDSIPIQGIEAIKNADIVYVEQFTNPIKNEFEKIKCIHEELKPAKRWLVEDGKEILENAKESKVVLVSYGDPYIATTHIELRMRAIKEKIRTVSVHGSSSVTSIVGECGLHYYKMGRIATIMDDEKSIGTPYRVTYENLMKKNHTILLLEYNQDRNFFLDPKAALEYMLCTEKNQKFNVTRPDTFCIVASRVGFEDQRIISGRISSLASMDFGNPPHSIIIPAEMHFTEVDALEVLSECIDEYTDNTTEKISVQMIRKYVPMVREALEEVRPHYEGTKEYDEILENAELYVRDAEQFLLEGKDEVAILSIGYADGLVDSLRMAKGMEPRIN